jgi:ABC-type methionine transport system permease subunit
MMNEAWHSSWFYWAIGIAIGFPVGLIFLTELHHTLVRRNSRLARQVGLVRNYLLPLIALLLLLVKASQILMEMIRASRRP